MPCCLLHWNTVDGAMITDESVVSKSDRLHYQLIPVNKFMLYFTSTNNNTCTFYYIILKYYVLDCNTVLFNRLASNTTTSGTTTSGTTTSGTTTSGTTTSGMTASGTTTSGMTTSGTTTSTSTTQGSQICGPTEFSCDNDHEKCIPGFLLCDSVKDCPNGEDEVHCPGNIPTVLVKHCV